jgi:aspartate/methionine/tyrosine aminotransferase
MKINVFKLEEYLARYEFSAPYLLCCSDAETLAMRDVLAMADVEDTKQWETLSLGYTEAQGLPKLRQGIAQSLYPTLHANNILCFAGAEDAIFCALNYLCEPLDHVVVLSPCYQSLQEIPRAQGAEVTNVHLREENNWRIDLAEIKKALKSTTKGVVINFPHNPTGQVISQVELLELINLCAQHDLWLFSDEVYRLLGSPREGWSAPAAQLYPKAISVGVMSKAFGMAGLRVGWLACQDQELLKKIEYVKHYTSICSSAPSEILSLIALKNADRILARNNKIVSENLAMLDQFFAEFPQLFSWVRPQGGCVGMVELKSPEPVATFCERLVKEKGVLLMPAMVYDMESNHFRIGFGRKNMPEALNKLREFIAHNHA